jgi:hypothetical protein
VPQDVRSIVSPSPSLPATRHIGARDVRDLALAVIEGAVAAEALAKELKRSPDRSRHFQDIAERLRAVVARASIRAALADESSSGTVVVSPSVTQVTPPIIPKVAPIEPPVAPPPTPARAPVLEEARTSGERAVPSLTTDELVALVKQALRGEAIETRLARLEHAVGAAAQEAADQTRRAVLEAAAQATATATAGERLSVSTPAEALALATRLTERVQAGVVVTVRIDNVPTSIRRG